MQPYNILPVEINLDSLFSCHPFVSWLGPMTREGNKKQDFNASDFIDGLKENNVQKLTLLIGPHHHVISINSWNKQKKILEKWNQRVQPGIFIMHHIMVSLQCLVFLYWNSFFKTHHKAIEIVQRIGCMLWIEGD